MSPSQWEPQGGTAMGRVDNRIAVDGFTVIQDYAQERGGMVTFRGHGVFSWDAKQGCYVLHWWDTMGMPPNIFRGQFLGEVLTMTDVESQVKSRVTWDFRGGGRHTFKMEMSPDGMQWQTMMEGTYKRALGAMAAPKPAAKPAPKAKAMAMPATKAKAMAKPATKAKAMAKPAKRTAARARATRSGGKRRR